MQQIGRWAFIVGVIIAVAAAFGFSAEWLPWVLAILGLIVGFMNVSGSEGTSFLIASIGLMMFASALESIPFIGGYATQIIANTGAFIGPAVLVVAIKTLLDTAKE